MNKLNPHHFFSAIKLCEIFAVIGYLNLFLASLYSRLSFSLNSGHIIHTNDINFTEFYRR